MRTIVAAALALFAVLPACAMSSAKDDAATGAQDVTSGDTGTAIQGMTAAPDDLCTSTLHFLQKDAYKNTGGRTTDLWPPHTTTVLEVTCMTANGAQTISPFDANHGSEPGSKDANGTPFLVETPMDASVVTTVAPWSETQKLVTAYTSCECQPDTFLSMNDVTPQAMGIISEVAQLFDCQQSVDDLVAAAQAKDVAKVTSILAGCTLKSDVTAEDFTTTTADIENSVKTSMAGKHVCNNDALLQADLFTHFRDTKKVATCNPHDANRCAFPSLFFSPSKEVH